jgi:hypothetical protein
VKTYHFSCGNSTQGPVGLCARVTARTKTEALTKLRRALQNTIGAAGELPVRVVEPDVQYINVYVSPEHIGLVDLDDN